MTHKQEIKRWANCPDGTKVWRQVEQYQWISHQSVSWSKDEIYIVDDEWAKIRIAVADKQPIQYKNLAGDWVDSSRNCVHDFTSTQITLSSYRLKPTEPVYEWQWIKETPDNLFCITSSHYNNYPYEGYVPFEPSKRERHE